MINNKLTPSRTHTRIVNGEVDGKPKDLKIILKIYDEPIRSTSEINIHCSFEILDGDSEWGHGLLPEAIPEEDIESALDALASQINLYKNKTGQSLNKVN